MVPLKPVKLQRHHPDLFTINLMNINNEVLLLRDTRLVWKHCQASGFEIDLRIYSVKLIKNKVKPLNNRIKGKMCQPANRSHSNSEVPPQRQVPPLGEGLDGSALVQDDDQIRHLSK